MSLKLLNKETKLCLSVLFLMNCIFQYCFDVKSAFATNLDLPVPNQILPSSDNYSYPVLRGVELDINNPYSFKFIIDSQSNARVEKTDVDNLVKYFLAGLSMQNEDIWVNLSPFEKDRVIDQSVGQTELGKDLLIQDYILKQFSSSLTDPAKELGKKYWAILNSNNEQSKVGLLNKIWISPNETEVYQKDNLVLITKASLKVEAELGSELKNLLLPLVSEEVNKGKSFSKLRQIFHSLILAKWFKESLRGSVYQNYFDSKATSAIEHKHSNVKEKVFTNYVKSFENGVYDTIRKEIENQHTVKRQYFCGGATMMMDIKRKFKLPQEYGDIDAINDGSSAVALVNVSSAISVIDVPVSVASKEQLEDFYDQVTRAYVKRPNGFYMNNYDYSETVHEIKRWFLDKGYLVYTGSLQEMSLSPELALIVANRMMKQKTYDDCRYHKIKYLGFIQDKDSVHPNLFSDFRNLIGTYNQRIKHGSDEVIYGLNIDMLRYLRTLTNLLNDLDDELITKFEEKNRIKLSVLNSLYNYDHNYMNQLDIEEIMENELSVEEIYEELSEDYKMLFPKQSKPGIQLLRLDAMLNPYKTYNLSYDEVAEWAGTTASYLRGVQGLKDRFLEERKINDNLVPKFGSYTALTPDLLEAIVEAYDEDQAADTATNVVLTPDMLENIAETESYEENQASEDVTDTVLTPDMPETVTEEESIEEEEIITNYQTLDGGLAALDNLSISEKDFAEFVDDFLRAYAYSQDDQDLPLKNDNIIYRFRYTNPRMFETLRAEQYIEVVEDSSESDENFSASDKFLNLTAKYILSDKFRIDGLAKNEPIALVITKGQETAQKVSSIGQLLELTSLSIKNGEELTVVMREKTRNSLRELYPLFRGLGKVLQNDIFDGAYSLADFKYVAEDYYDSREKVKLSELVNKSTVENIYSELSDEEKSFWRFNDSQGMVVLGHMLANYDIDYDVSFNEFKEWINVGVKKLRDNLIGEKFYAKSYRQNVNRAVKLPKLTDSVSDKMLDRIVSKINTALRDNTVYRFKVKAAHNDSEYTIEKVLQYLHQQGHLIASSEESVGVYDKQDYRLSPQLAIHVLEKMIVSEEVNPYSTTKKSKAFIHADDESNVDSFQVNDLYSLLLTYRDLLSQGKGVVLGFGDELRESLEHISKVAKSLDEETKEILLNRLGLEHTIFDSVLNYPTQNPFPSSLSEIVKNNTLEEFMEEMPADYASIFGSSTKSKFWRLIGIFAHEIEFDITYEQALLWSDAGANFTPIKNLQNNFINRHSRKGAKADKEGSVKLVMSFDKAVNLYDLDQFFWRLPRQFSIHPEWENARNVVHFIVDSYSMPLNITDVELAKWLGISVSTMTLYFKEAFYQRKNKSIGKDSYYSDIFTVTKESLQELDRKMFLKDKKNKSKPSGKNVDFKSLSQDIDALNPISLYEKFTNHIIETKPKDFERSVVNILVQNYTMPFDVAEQDLADWLGVKLSVMAVYLKEAVLNKQGKRLGQNFYFSDVLDVSDKGLQENDHRTIQKMTKGIFRNKKSKFNIKREKELALVNKDLTRKNGVYWAADHSEDYNADYKKIVAEYGLKLSSLNKIDRILFSKDDGQDFKMFIVEEKFEETVEADEDKNVEDENFYSFLRLYDFLHYMINKKENTVTHVSVTGKGSQLIDALSEHSIHNKQISELARNDLDSMDMLRRPFINEYIETNFGRHNKAKELHYFFMTRHGTEGLNFLSIADSFAINQTTLIDFINKYYPSYDYLIKEYKESKANHKMASNSNKKELDNKSNSGLIDVDFDFEGVLGELYNDYLSENKPLLDKSEYGPFIINSLISKVQDSTLTVDERLVCVEMLNHWLDSQLYDHYEIFDIYQELMNSNNFDDNFIRSIAKTLEFVESAEFNDTDRFVAGLVAEIKPKDSGETRRKAPKKQVIRDGGVDFKFDVKANTYDLPEVWQINNAVDLSNIDFVVSSLYSVDSLNEHFKVN